MQETLELMNVKLTMVVSDITGVTGLSIIRAIVAGECDPQHLARLRKLGCARSEAEIAKALQGNYQAEHLFVLKQALAQDDFYLQQLQECDAELETSYAALSAEHPVAPTTPPPALVRYKRHKNQAHFDLATAPHQLVGVDLTAIDDIDVLMAQAILTEIGTDVDAWPKVKHFASWLDLAPYNDKSGGKILRRGDQEDPESR